MAALGRVARSEHTVYLVGGATAVLEGWRGSTVDIDIDLPDRASAEELLRARDEALGHMRRGGIIVLDVPPAQAARAVLTQYVELKRRGVL